jgi:hypothetical protein
LPSSPAPSSARVVRGCHSNRVMRCGERSTECL